MAGKDPGKEEPEAKRVEKDVRTAGEKSAEGGALVGRLGRFIESRDFQVLISLLLLVNAAIVGLQTYALGARVDHTLNVLDRVLLLGFTAELIARFSATRPRLAYFKDPWNLFDVFVVGVSYIPAGAFVSAIRVLRVLRILRAISTSPVLRKLLTALGRSLLPMGHLVLLLSIIMYTYAVLGTILFGQIAPELFGSLHGSVLTLFTVLTLEGWPDVMRQLLPDAPWAWVYFVSFLFIGTYMTMNFVIGIIVNTLNELGKEEEKQEEVREEGQSEVLKRIEERLERIEKSLAARTGDAPGGGAAKG
jgi:voltage-gated sodium channel